MALGVYEKLHGKEHRKIAIANNNIGSVYRVLKLYGEAVTSFESAEAIWKRIYPEGHPNQALALVNLGRTYADMGNATSAMGYYERALAMYRKAYGDKHSDIAAVLNQMGLLRQTMNYDESLTYFQLALVANAPAFSSADVAANPRTTDYYNAKVMLYSLRLKAETLESRYLGKTLKLSDMKLALATLQTCDTLIDNIRFNSTNESDKLEIGASANDVYENGVRIAQAISEVTLQTAAYEKIAFYFAEKSKSAVLQESIADAEAKSFAGIPEALLETENTLKASLALLTQKLSQKPSPQEEQVLRESIFQTSREYQAFVRKLEMDYPDYFNLKFNRAAPSIADIQKLLGPEKSVVSYFIAEKSARLYTFVITQKSFKVYSSTIPADFERLLKGFTNGIFYVAQDVYESSSGKLSALLLRGVPNTKEIVFIPAGRLGTLPFEALFRGTVKKGSDFSSYPYLLNRHAISYEFSAGLLLQKSAHQATSGKSSIFLCAPIRFPEKDNLNDLPGTQQEVTAIASLFGTGARVAIGPSANETLIKSGDLASYQYLHFATHGIVDETSPELSRIYLQNTATEDGNVFSGEIFNLKLNADLCVLSACQTGLGKYSKGEGVIGLSRALVYAGARTIMVSYWSVADESTAELMSEFYRILLTQPGMNQRTALQQAKQNMVKRGKFSSPFFWAPFVLIGS
jgi:CHAT domain-containing protein